MKIQFKKTILTIYETIYCLISFSISLTFGGKVLKTLWIGLAISTYFFIDSLLYAILFTIAFAILMFFTTTIFLIGFSIIFSKRRD